MLKMVFALMFLMKMNKEWELVQAGLMFLSFMFSVICYHNFYLYQLGFNLGLDYIGYILVLLSCWIMSLVILGSQKIKNLSNFCPSFIKVNLILVLCLVFTKKFHHFFFSFLVTDTVLYFLSVQCLSHIQCSCYPL